MDLDWCTEESLSNTKNFNENLVINKEKKHIVSVEKDQEKIYRDININECFNLNLEVNDSKELLVILNYLSLQN